MTTVTTTDNSKRRELVEAAFHEIAHKGFTGLRTRDVAAQVSITQATLHYYFSTKQKLIEAVVIYAVEQIDTVRAIQTCAETQNPLQELQRHFADIVLQMQREPAVFIVLDEIALYARRDETIAQVIVQSERGWKSYLVDLLHRGITQAVFNPDLNAEGCAELIVAFFKGAVLQVEVVPGSLQCAIVQLETWIIAKR